MPMISDTITMSRRSHPRTLVARIQRRLEGEEGFTLVELTIVLLILGILISIAVPSYLTFKDNAAKTAAKQNVAQVIRDVAAYGADNYPGSPNDPDPAFAGPPSGLTDSGYERHRPRSASRPPLDDGSQRRKASTDRQASASTSTPRTAP